MRTVSRRAAIVSLMAPFIVAGSSWGAEPDDVRAPFGLAWGISSDETRKAGVVLKQYPKMSDYGVAFDATSLPKVIDDIEMVTLWFGYNDRLWRIGAFGKSVGPDPYGDRLVARYQELSSSLAERYGRGREVDARDTKIWKSPSEYLMSLKQGRASRFISFDSPSTSVELSVRASDNDMGFYVLLFENKPGARQFRNDKRGHEKDAL